MTICDWTESDEKTRTPWHKRTALDRVIALYRDCISEHQSDCTKEENAAEYALVAEARLDYERLLKCDVCGGPSLCAECVRVGQEAGKP